MTLAHDIHGEGPPLLLVHGMALDRRMWDPNMPALTEHHRVVRCDLRGFGATPPPEAPCSHADDLRDLLGVLGIERAAVCGLSMGGGVALELAIAHPEVVSALVLVGTDLPGVPLDEGLRATIAPVGAAVRAGDIEGARTAWLQTPLFARSPPDVAAALERIVGDYTFWHLANRGSMLWLEPPAAGRGDEVRCPALVLWGEHDVAQIASNSDHIAGAIPDARTVVLAGAGHMANMEAPDAFDAALLAFLGAVGA